MFLLQLCSCSHRIQSPQKYLMGLESVNENQDRQWYFCFLIKKQNIFIMNKFFVFGFNNYQVIHVINVSAGVRWGAGSRIALGKVK